MELNGVHYFTTLGEISATFVGLSALIMSFRHSAGGAMSPLYSWITLVFIQLGFIVTAGSLTPELLILCGVPASVLWRACSGGVGAAVALFAVTYPLRRSAVSGVRTPLYVWFDLVLLFGCVAALSANVFGAFPSMAPGLFAVGLTGVLFVAGLGYLHALSAMHEDSKRTIAQ